MWYDKSVHELANHVTGERKEMKSFLLKISQCHLLTNLGRLAQLPLWQPSQVYVENSQEVIVKVSKSGLALCRLNSFNLTPPCLSLLSNWGKRQKNSQERQEKECKAYEIDMHKHNAGMEKYANRCFHSLIHLSKREIKAYGDNAHFPIIA